MNLALKLAALDQIYGIYDEFADSLEVACVKTCTHCCTTNVTLTTLEAYKIVDHLIANRKLDVIGRLQNMAGITRYKPQITTNRLAQLCAAGAKPPEEKCVAEWDKCALLEKSLCSIYDLRPFGCRCFFSRKNCAKMGYADIDDFTMSLNTVFLQTIEHLDAEGCSGNLIDTLPMMATSDTRQAYKKDKLSCEKSGLLVNWPLKVLMIPPEHRTRIEPILQQLRQIKN